MKQKDIALINEIINSHEQRYKPSVIWNSDQSIDRKADLSVLNTDWKQISPIRLVQKDEKRWNLLISQSDASLPVMKRLKKEKTFDASKEENTLQIGVIGHHANIEKKYIGNLRQNNESIHLPSIGGKQSVYSKAS
mgnify:CR=1 FL=1